MTDARATAALIGGIELLERAINYNLGSLQSVTPRALGDPTPCSAWDLRSLLWHLDDSFTALHEATARGRVRLDNAAANNSSGHELIRTVRNRACQLVGAWANAEHSPPTVTIAGVSLANSIVTSAGAIEVTVHGWDIARACGTRHPIPPALADELLQLSMLMVSDADRPTRFATAIEAPTSANPGDRLLAFLGRDPAAGAGHGF